MLKEAAPNQPSLPILERAESLLPAAIAEEVLVLVKKPAVIVSPFRAISKLRNQWEYRRGGRRRRCPNCGKKQLPNHECQQDNSLVRQFKFEQFTIVNKSPLKPSGF